MVTTLLKLDDAATVRATLPAILICQAKHGLGFLILGTLARVCGALADGACLVVALDTGRDVSSDELGRHEGRAPWDVAVGAVGGLKLELLGHELAHQLR